MGRILNVNSTVVEKYRERINQIELKIGWKLPVLVQKL